MVSNEGGRKSDKRSGEGAHLGPLVQSLASRPELYRGWPPTEPFGMRSMHGTVFVTAAPLHRTPTRFESAGFPKGRRTI